MSVRFKTGQIIPFLRSKPTREIFGKQKKSFFFVHISTSIKGEYVSCHIQSVFWNKVTLTLRIWTKRKKTSRFRKKNYFFYLFIKILMSSVSENGKKILKNLEQISTYFATIGKHFFLGNVRLRPFSRSYFCWQTFRM